MRVVVVGASSGLGRSIGVGLAQAGENVALLARREDRLVDATKEAGNGALAIRCDVTDQASCTDAIAAAAAGLGGIDAVVYSTGVGHIGRIEELTVDTWHHSFDTNVIGASLVTAAALPHLKESHGMVAYLSSISASQTAPWPGMGAYMVSKVAMEKLVDVWRSEHPTIGFTKIFVGDCAGGEGDSTTEFINNWDNDLMTEFGTIWYEKGYITGTLMPVEELISLVHTVLKIDNSTSIPFVMATPRPAG